MPLVQKRLQAMQRLSTIRKIEKLRGSRVITLIHRQETMSLLGFPIARYIDVEDSEQLLRAIRLTPPEMPIGLEEAKSLGLLVRDELPREVYELMELYPQTRQQRPSVEFIPTPYRTPASGPDNGERK